MTLVLGLALPASAGAFVYWANMGSNTIGRASVNGTDVNQEDQGKAAEGDVRIQRLR